MNTADAIAELTQRRPELHAPLLSVRGVQPGPRREAALRRALRSLRQYRLTAAELAVVQKALHALVDARDTAMASRLRMIDERRRGQ